MQSKIETISLDALHEVQGALSALIGSDICLSILTAQLQKKDMVLEQQHGNNVYIGLELKGTYQGEGCLIISTTSAIKLSGKMLMQPPADINLALSEGDFEEETEFVFEEVTRAIITSYIKTFQSSGTLLSSIVYKKRKVLSGVPEGGDLDILKDDQTYYRVSADVSMDGLSIGTLSLLLPAFMLLYSSYFQNGAGECADFSDQAGTRVDNDDEEIREVSRMDEENSGFEFLPFQAKDSEADMLFAPPLLDAARELSNLLEVFVSIVDTNRGFVDGESVYRALQTRPHLMTRFTVNGGLEEDLMIVVKPEHGVWLGALLSEGVHGAVLARLQEASLNGDRQDGFVEICTIFIDFLIKSIRSELQKDIEITQKRIVDYASEDSSRSALLKFAERDYYLSIFRLSAGPLGSADMHLLIPVALIEPLLPKDDKGHASAAMKAALSPTVAVQDVEQEVDGPMQPDLHIETSVLVIDAGSDDGRVIQSQLAEAGVTCTLISSTAEIERSLLESFSAIILAVKSLNETALGIAIKVNAISSVPLIVAASRWTQSDVFKAVRYGVVEILVTPTTPGEVVEKLRDVAERV